MDAAVGQMINANPEEITDWTSTTFFGDSDLCVYTKQGSKKASQPHCLFSVIADVVF